MRPQVHRFLGTKATNKNTCVLAIFPETLNMLEKMKSNLIKLKNPKLLTVLLYVELLFKAF